MDSYDRGSAILIEIETKQQAPFGALAYFDPSALTISVTDPEGTELVADATTTRSTTGKYYYICQTDIDWKPGDYEVVASTDDGTFTDITTAPLAFRLE